MRNNTPMSLNRFSDAEASEERNGIEGEYNDSKVQLF